MKRLLSLIVLALLIGLPAAAQDVRVEGNIGATERDVYDSAGVKSAVKLGTAGATVTGTLTLTNAQLVTGSFDAVLNAELILCGQQADNGTIYMGPGLGELDGTQTVLTIGGTACNALDNATEATADAPIGFANNAFKVYGMLCEVSSSGSNGVTITGRSAAADLSPSMSCTVATTETSCVDVLATPATVAAGATIAIKVVNTEDLSAQDAWCRWFIGFTE